VWNLSLVAVEIDRYRAMAAVRRLMVEVVAAKELMPKDGQGTANAYCVVSNLRVYSFQLFPGRRLELVIVGAVAVVGKALGALVSGWISMTRDPTSVSVSPVALVLKWFEVVWSGEIWGRWNSFKLVLNLKVVIE